MPLLGPAIRPVAEAQLHLTLRFIGETPDDRLLLVEEAVRAATVGIEPFDFVVAGLGCFPHADAARVLWAGIEPCAPLQTLAERIEQELRARGFPPEMRRFSPHLTLARAKGRPARLREPLDPSQPRFGEQAVDDVVIFESRMSPRGSQYVPIANVPLGE